MAFQVGDWVLPDMRCIWGAGTQGEIHRVTQAMGYGVYEISDDVGHCYYYPEQYLSQVFPPMDLTIKVSVGWDLTKDLSITQAQYEKICLHAEKTGRTTTEVLRMLLASAMECFLEESPQC